MFEELDRVILTEDLPDHGLKAGDVGTVVLVHRGGAGYEVEFVALDGETFAVVSVHPTRFGRPLPARSRTLALWRNGVSAAATAPLAPSASNRSTRDVTRRAPPPHGRQCGEHVPRGGDGRDELVRVGGMMVFYPKQA